MNENSSPGEEQETNHFQKGRNVVQLPERIDHHRHGRTGIDKSSKVHLAQGNDESCVDGQEQHKIEFAGADILRHLSAIGQEKSLENLLDKVARSHQQNNLPFGPVSDVVRVLINDADEGESQRKPKQFGKNPEQEVGLATHLANDGALP